MKTCLDCISCFFRQALEASRMVSDDEALHKEVLQEVAKEFSNICLDESPPSVSRKIHKIVRDLTGSLDPYKEVKDKYNQMALGLYPQLREKVLNSADPLLTSIRMVIAGNIIDFGVGNSFDVEKEIKEAFHKEFATLDYSIFCDFIEDTEEVLYLGDNAGEVVFDRLLVEVIESMGKRVVYAVRGAPIINDATLDDARECGIHNDVTELISTGSDAPATVLELCSPDFIERFNGAKMIISKGQGNFEALSGEKRPIFFLFKVKCPVVAENINHEVGDMVLSRGQSFGLMGQKL